MATDKRILYTEDMVGATHPSLADTLNRALLIDHQNSGAHRYVAYELTNSAAGSTAVADVLAVSSQTAILGDTLASLQKYVVAVEIIANAATGRFASNGPVSAKSTGTIAAMQYVRKSATARAIEDAGVAVGATTVPPKGAIGFALAAASGNLCTIYLFDRTVSGATRIITKLANESLASSTTLQNDDELLYAMATNEDLAFTVILFYTAAAAADIKAGLTIPGGTIRYATGHSSGAQVSGGQFGGEWAGSDTLWRAEGTVLNATAGNLQVQWAQLVSDVGNTTVYAGSMLVIHSGG